MSPTDIRRSLASYADGELDPDIRAEVEAYLADHPEARVEVERWRALRSCAGRAMAGEAIPDGLAGRIQERLAQGHQPLAFLGLRVKRVGGPGLALAAGVLLAVLFWPRGAGAGNLMRAGQLVEYHRLSAVQNHADALNARDGADWRNFRETEDAYVRIARNAPFRCVLPSMQAAGYALVGATKYRSDGDLAIIHAYFKCIGKSNVVSLFIIDRPVKICDADTDCHPVGQTGRYRAVKKDRFTFVTWTENNRTYILCCGVANEAQLAALADRLKPIVAPTCDGYRIVDPNAAEVTPQEAVGATP